MMENVKVSPFEVVKEELCSRYGLDPEQINFEVSIKGVEKELGDEIVKDYARNKFAYNTDGDLAAYAVNDYFWLWAHYKKEEGSENEDNNN